MLRFIFLIFFFSTSLINEVFCSQPIRSLRIDLDHIYDGTDNQQMERNIKKLVKRIGQYKINTVFLEAYDDDEGLGYAKSLYFPNRHLPMKADLLKRVIIALKKEHPTVDYYAWMPIIGFDIGNDALLIRAIDTKTGKTVIDSQKYKRFSPFNPHARQIILDIFEDLSKNVPIDGIAFHDDGVMTDFEDASPAAIQAQMAAGFPDSIIQIRSNHPLFLRWSRWKTEALTNFTKDIIKLVKRNHPHLKTTRSLFSLPILNPDSEEWFAQNLNNFLEAYDFAAIEAMPYMENAKDPQKWMDKLISKVAEHPHGLEKSLFELQSVDWRFDNKPIDPSILASQMTNLKEHGALNFGYYPDDFLQEIPNSSIIGPELSIQ